MRKFSFIILILIFSSFCFAQTENDKTETSIKVAVINSETFFDESTGIIELVLAKKELDEEFEPLNQDLLLKINEVEKCNNEIKKIAEYMNSPEPNPQVCFGSISIRDRVFKCENLIKETEEKREDVKVLYEKRKLEIFADVNKKIENALKLFAEQKGYSVVLDSSKINSSGVILGIMSDITKEFIQFYKEQSIKKEAQ